MMHVDIILLLTIVWTVIVDYSSSPKSNKRFSDDSANTNNNTSSIHGVHQSVVDQHPASFASIVCFDYSEYFS
jgi:hypothetical protein